nr:PREDICTED: zonadhesin-like [Megachile rotundata]
MHDSSVQSTIRRKLIEDTSILAKRDKSIRRSVIRSFIYKSCFEYPKLPVDFKQLMIENRISAIMRQSLAVIAVLAATAYAYSECPPTGIHNIPHEKDCGLYYECKDGSKTEKECLGGLSFDPVNGICGWPPRSECVTYVDPTDEQCPPAGSDQAKRIPHECSCHKYYECINGKKFLQHCRNGTEFDYIREVCDIAARAECYCDENEVLMVQDNVCPAEGITRVPHEYDCNLYYNCQNGLKYLGKCLDGHYYNDVIKACDLPENVNCNGKTPFTTTPRISEVDECPACNCDNCYTRYPHSICSKYYECNNGNKTVKDCPEGLHFNPVTQMCDWPDNVNCTVPPPPCTAGNRTHHECRCEKYYECQDEGWVVETCPKGTEFDFELGKCVPENEANCWPGVKPPPGCMETCLRNESKIVVHENCTQYCECDHGKMTLVNCSENMYFNPDKKKCDWPENIRNLTCTPFPCTNTTIPHECTCELYYQCKNGVAVRQECPRNTEYNYEAHTCMPNEDAHCYKEVYEDTVIESESCISTCPKSSDHTDRSYVLAHRNCTKFCRCGSGAPYVVQCRSGFHFSSEKGICIEPAAAKCSKLYMYGVEQRDSDTYSSWYNILPFYKDY